MKRERIEMIRREFNKNHQAHDEIRYLIGTTRQEFNALLQLALYGADKSHMTPNEIREQEKNEHRFNCSICGKELIITKFNCASCSDTMPMSIGG